MTSQGNKSWNKLKLKEATATTDLKTEKDKHDKTKAVCGGGLTLLKEKNVGKICAEKESNRLLNIILATKNKDLCIQAVQGRQIAVKYDALPSKYTNKKGDVSDCYISVYGKYAGRMYNNVGDKLPPPRLNFWITYSEDVFDFNPDNEGFGLFTLKKDCVADIVFPSDGLPLPDNLVLN